MSFDRFYADYPGAKQEKPMRDAYEAGKASRFDPAVLHQAKDATREGGTYRSPGELLQIIRGLIR